VSLPKPSVYVSDDLPSFSGKTSQNSHPRQEIPVFKCNLTDTQIISIRQWNLAELQHQFHDQLLRYMTFISKQAWASLLESSRA
jgi:hypothetical protein